MKPKLHFHDYEPTHRADYGDALESEENPGNVNAVIALLLAGMILFILLAVAGLIWCATA